jgi:hypothetical protein
VTKIVQTDNAEKILSDFIDRMDKIQKDVKGFEGKPEVFMAYSLKVQIESEKARLSVELSKMKILEALHYEIKNALRLAKNRGLI